MHRDAWSTGLVSKAERFDYWNEVICDAVLNVQAERKAKGDFRAQLRSNRLPLGNFVRFHSEAHDIVRSHRLLRAKPDERYLVSVQLSGLCHVTQGERQFTLHPGDIGVISAARTMHLAFEGDIERAVAVIPRATLEASCGWLSPGGAIRMDRARPVTRILSQVITELAAPEGRLATSDQVALGKTFLDLIANCNDGRRPTAREEGIRLRLMDHLSANLADPDLSPSSAAAEIGISERMVHMLFVGTGLTCQRWIIEKRLARAATALRAPEWSHCNISEIAFRQGFNDLSHFSRRFKERYSCSPREYRAKPN